MGVTFSIIALISWGIGDFLIQKSARKFGSWIALFYITAFASIVLLPFVYKDLVPLIWNLKGLFILLAASLVITFAGYFDFEALRIGKISVVEPIYTFEIAVVAILSAVLIKEYLDLRQIVLVAMIIAGIFLVSVKSLHAFKNIKWEKGVVFAIIATAGMGVANFLFGAGARSTNPLLINWFTSTFVAFVCLFFLARQSQIKQIFQNLKDNSWLILSVSFMDNMAWVFFCYATLYIPIAIATSISESYIALAAILGMKFNQEKLGLHQKFGLIATIVAAVVLSLITKD